MKDSRIYGPKRTGREREVCVCMSALLSSVEHKRRYFEVFGGGGGQTVKVVWTH